ncbi:surface carbohydrate biosynthesis protein [Bradyrhizobium sp. AZCC 1693]|uniref:surface carbohydrate biosynthesis protein n=1 Tax=Bradyrhizobium sp. AZCC 1693 TaxID=3117029 RepID=UPI002FF3E93B
MPDKPHVCLIVDNPLRDLEGLVLLGRQLAAKGATATLVPMYEQGFDVPVLRPDLVLVNYTRPNNADLIKSYKRAGILVGVLDTEGIGGKNPDQFAEMVKSVGCTDLVDLYCVWGQAQHAAFLRHGTVPAGLLHATGCPRYDFCAPPWRAALPKPSIEPGYVLINTNFPVANPRFSRSSSDEEDAMVQAGFSREFARQFIIDAGKSYRSVLETSTRLANHFPDVQFVLRPHPFENIGSYDALAELPNCHIRQDGTSLEWISGARLLVHQNCSTAIEATMLKVEPLSMEWFNTPSLRLDAATRVSRSVGSEADLIELVRQGLDGRLPPVAQETEQFRQQIIGDLFTAVDGTNSLRVTAAVLDAIATRGEKRAASKLERPSLRGVAADAVRRALGYKASSALRRSYSAPESERRRLGKAFAPEMVNSVLRRICAAAGDDRNFVAQRVTGNSRRVSRALSGASLQLTEAT